jgi:hypothetical protein
MAVPMIAFIASMCLVGIKHAETFFRPLWLTVFVVDLIGTTLLVLGAIEINFPGAVSSQLPAVPSGYWNFIGITFFLFPISLIVTTLRFPFRLVKWQQ